MTAKRPVYAAYKGDTFIDIGTKKELADRLDVKPETIQHYMSPTYKKRAGKNGMAVIRLDDKEAEDDPEI